MFSMNGLLYQVAKWVFRLVMSNVLFILFSVFIITIPASFLALCSVMSQWLQGEEDFSLFQEFKRQFFTHFRRSTMVSLLYLVILVLLIENYHVVSLTARGIAYWAMLSFLGFITLCWLITYIYIFPVIYQTNLSIGRALVMALRIGIYKPQFTLLNIAALCIIAYTSSHVVILVPLLFFSTVSLTICWAIRLKAVFPYEQEQAVSAQ